MEGKTYFGCRPKCGVFVRADRVDTGDFAVLALDESLDSAMEEL